MVGQGSEVTLLCEDTLVTQSLRAEVESYATVRKLMPKKQPEQKKVEQQSRKKSNWGQGLINNGVVTILLYLFVAALLIGIIVVLIKQLRPPELIEKRVVNLDEIEDIAELNVDEELDKALGDGDLRLAVRIQYLRVLQRLSEQESIRWKPKKTNSDYVVEMRNHELYGIFKMITRNYDYVWYGKREVTKDLYDQWLPYFDQFFENVSYGE